MTKNILNSAIVVLMAALAFGCNAKQGDNAKPGETATAKKGATADKGAAADSNDIIPIGDAYTKGGKDALVTIVEFSDFQCPFCSRVNPTLKSIADQYGDKVRVAFKHNPLPFHKDAPLASQAAIAAGAQGKFWEMHDKLFENTKALKPDDIDGYAKDLGLDMAKFKTDLDSKATKDIVAADMALAAKVGARGTPNFMINGTQLSGAQPLPKFVEVIDAELKEAEALAKTGKTPAEIYTARVKANFKEPAKRPDAKGDDSSDTVYKIPADGVGKGGKEPLVTIIEFSEFQCPFCTRAVPTIQEILKTYGDDVKIIFKHNPLPFHKDAPRAAQAAIAAGNQGKFWEMHDKLFQDTKKLQQTDVDGYAQELGLDMAKFKADMESDETKKQIDADQALASQFGARGTPNFFVNGRQVTGARPFAAFKTIIDEEIIKANAAIKAGTPRGEVYAKLTEKGLTKAAAPPARKPRAEDNTVYKMPVGDSKSIKGPADALVTIIEFSEFQCPFCSRVNPTIDEITKKYGNDVRVVFKHNPLPFHKEAPGASAASIAAGNQGKFWEMHDVLFKNQKALKTEDLNGYAKELGLDMNKFAADMESDATKKLIAADQALASQFGASGTPNFFINGRKLVGAQPVASFTKIIDEEIAKANAKLKAGVARAKIYDELTKDGATKASAAPRGAPPEDDSKVYDVKISDADAVKGPKNAPITIVEYSDFQCPFCSRVNPTLKQVQDTYGDKVKIVFKHNPLSFHKDAPLASEAALAAGAQGKFWEMHDLLFKNTKALKRPDLDKYAQELGLNMATFKSDLDSNKYKSQVDNDIASARALGASGTPSFFINGRKLRGAQPFDSFKRIIDEELKKKGK